MPYFTVILALVFTLLNAAINDQIPTITADNIEHLSLSAEFDGACSAITHDEQWLVTNDSIYAIDTGQQVFELPDPQVFIAFSDDGELAHINGITYSTETWQTIDDSTVPDFALFTDTEGNHYVWRDFTVGNGIPTYLSPQGNYWVHVLEGIYQTDTGELLTLPEALQNPALLEIGEFSADDRLFFVDDIAYLLPAFEEADNPSSEIADKSMSGFSINAIIMDVSANEEIIAVYPDGVFDLARDEKLLDITPDTWQMQFSADGSLLFSLNNTPELHIADIQSGEIIHTISARGFLLGSQAHYLAITSATESCQIFTINAQ